MSSLERGQESPPGESVGAKSFPTTHWTMVLSAGRNESTHAEEALARLCQAYWYPLYAFVRRRGYGPQDAQDLTQGFFAHVLEKHSLIAVAPERRFRTFLLAALKNYLANEWDKAHARKRGGGKMLVSLEQQSAESRYGIEPGHEMTPERLFERRWALTLLEQVLDTLRGEFQAEGNGRLFDELKGALTGESGGYALIAERLGRTQGAVKVAVHRLRHRYRELTREKIAETVADGDIEDEMRHLLTVLDS